MKKSHRIKPVQHLAEKNEQIMSAEYVAARQRYDDACNKLEELQTYQSEYAASISAQQSAGHLDVARMHEDRKFLARLAEVVRLQQQAVEGQRLQLDDAKQKWVQSRHRSKSLDTLADNYQRQEAAEAERLEQRATDDLTTQRFVWRALHSPDLA